MNLSMTELLKLTDFAEVGIKKWIDYGVIRPVGETVAAGLDGKTATVPTFNEQTCFALYVGSKYWKEKAPAKTVEGVVHFVASQSMSTIKHEVEAGRSWPAPSVLLNRATRRWRPGTFIVPPFDDVTSLAIRMAMRRLDLKVLLPEFRDRAQGGIQQIVEQPVVRAEAVSPLLPTRPEGPL